MSVIREFLPHPLRLLLWFSRQQKSNFLYPCTVFFWPRRWAKSEEKTPRKQQFHWLGWPTTFKNRLFLEKKFLPLQYQPNIFNLHFSILQNKRWNFFSYPWPRAHSIREGSALRTNPLPFYIPFLPQKILVSYTFYLYWHIVPLSHTYCS